MSFSSQNIFLEEDLFSILRRPGLINKATRYLEHHQGLRSFSLSKILLKDVFSQPGILGISIRMSRHLEHH